MQEWRKLREGWWKPMQRVAEERVAKGQKKGTRYVHLVTVP